MKSKADSHASKSHRHIYDSLVMLIRGRVQRGLGAAGPFTQLPWVVQQCREKLGFVPFPGTVNLEVLPEDQPLWEKLKIRPGKHIEPPDASSCEATCHPALIGGRVHGAIIIPHVPDYAATKVELLAPMSLARELGLGFGDALAVEVDSRG